MTREQARSFNLVTLQLDNARLPLATRLAQVSDVLADALADITDATATLCVLPAYFNGAYGYDDAFSSQTESPTGTTFAWMREQAQQHNVYLAGAWLVQDSGDVFLSAFLVAPDGQHWRNDAQHPFLWERAYFRDGATPHIAHTPIGRIGMVIGYDGAYPDVWQRLGGRVDAVLMLGAIPDSHTLQLVAPDDSLTEVSNLGFAMRALALHVTRWVNALNMQAQWLGVPIVCAGLSGRVRSEVPAPRFSGYVLTIERTDLREISGEDVRIQAHMKRITQIIGADGQPLQRTGADGTAWLSAHVAIPTIRPVPTTEPPATDLSPVLQHILLPLLQAGLALNYRRIVRRQWGAMMAQPDAKTRWWQGTIISVAGLAMLLGIQIGRRIIRRK